MDETDQRLIAELRRDGRAALSDLAARLDISRATVRARLERLEAKGEIAFTVLTRSDVTAAPVRALMMVGIEGRGAERIMARLSGFPAVLAIHTTNGKWDLIVELGTQTLAELDEVIFRIRGLDGVTTSETNLLLGTRKASSADHIAATSARSPAPPRPPATNNQLIQIVSSLPKYSTGVRGVKPPLQRPKASADIA
ncbi:MAG: Lrp/AsnC family transcriptional regulator [Exiguobacterium profundum]|nr:MAG: Lrp/AsnC family transcriptional regulator [Exiguobacterium profundum]